MIWKPLPPSTTRNHFVVLMGQNGLVLHIMYFAWSFCIKLVPHQLTVILGLVSTRAIFWKLIPGKPVVTHGLWPLPLPNRVHTLSSHRNLQNLFSCHDRFSGVINFQKRPSCSSAPGLLLADEAPTWYRNSKQHTKYAVQDHSGLWVQQMVSSGWWRKRFVDHQCLWDSISHGNSWPG